MVWILPKLKQKKKKRNAPRVLSSQAPELKCEVRLASVDHRNVTGSVADDHLLLSIYREPGTV